MNDIDRADAPTEPLFDAERGYDRVARVFRLWPWSKFWQFNEAPIVREWLQHQKHGLGVDLGSGAAPYAADVRRFGHRAIDLDLSWRMLSCIPASGALRVQSDARHLPLRTGVADWLLSTRVFSHIQNVEGVVKECARVVKSGGCVLITDVHPQHPYSTVSIPTGSGESVQIETYKHDLRMLRHAISDAGFVEIAIREYSARDLSVRLHFAAFEKLYRKPTTPVFYTLTCRRR
jgi:SAM-dependent methyltransferase